MTARATAQLVGDVIELDVTIPLTPFIAAAHALVERLCAPVCTDEAELTTVETWLAAHFYAVARDPRAVNEEAGGVSSAYQMTSAGQAKSLEVTDYGKTAMMLDSTGELSRANAMSGEVRAAATVRMFHLGSTPASRRRSPFV